LLLEDADDLLLAEPAFHAFLLLKLQRIHALFWHTFRGLRQPEALPGEGVRQVERSETSAVSQAIVNKVHRPPLSWPHHFFDRAAFLTLDPLLTPFSQGQLFFAIKPICLLVIEVPAVQS
jgi:hypothetical protein